MVHRYLGFGLGVGISQKNRRDSLVGDLTASVLLLGSCEDVDLPDLGLWQHEGKTLGARASPHGCEATKLFSPMPFSSLSSHRRSRFPPPSHPTHHHRRLHPSPPTRNKSATPKVKGRFEPQLIAVHPLLTLRSNLPASGPPFTQTTTRPHQFPPSPSSPTITSSIIARRQTPSPPLCAFLPV